MQDWKRHICIIAAKIHDTFANLPVKNPPTFRLKNRQPSENAWKDHTIQHLDSSAALCGAGRITPRCTI